MNNVRIKADRGKTEVFINNRKISRITGLRFEQDPGEIPRLEIDMCALPDFEVDDADIQFSITPFSVVSALNVIRTALRQDKVSTEEVLDSICYMLMELTKKEPDCCVLVKWGEILTGRIIKEEVDDENHDMRTFVVNTSD